MATTIALFHSVLGVREGVLDAAARLRAAGHEVLVVDQYDGRSFADYESADAFATEIGYPALMQRAVEAVTELPDGFVVAGFSNGAGMAEFVATQRRCSGALLFSGALPLEMLQAPGWPESVPAQLHYTLADPFRRQEWIDQLVAAIAASGATLESFDYPGGGHLFTDPSRPDEYDADAAALLWDRALAFLAALPTPPA